MHAGKNIQMIFFVLLKQESLFIMQMTTFCNILPWMLLFLVDFPHYSNFLLNDLSMMTVFHFDYVSCTHKF